MLSPRVSFYVSHLGETRQVGNTVSGFGVAHEVSPTSRVQKPGVYLGNGARWATALGHKNCRGDNFY